MKTAALALIAAALCGPAMAETPQQFSLHCDGTKAFDMTDKHEGGSWYGIINVDLSRRLWCDVSKCKVAKPIKEVSPGELVLLEEYAQPYGADRDKLPHGYIKVDRVSGHYSALFFTDQPRQLMKIEAQCERGDFGGFPDTKF